MDDLIGTDLVNALAQIDHTLQRLVKATEEITEKIGELYYK